MNLDTFWEVWYYFILYGIWLIFGLELLYKFLFFRKLISLLGKDLKSYPDVSKLKTWRKLMLWFLSITTFAMIVFAIIYNMNVFLSIPIMIIAGLVYINGKLKSKIFSYIPTIFWSDKGLSAYPLGSLFKFPIIKFEEIDEVSFDKKNTLEYLNIKTNNKNYRFMVNDFNKTIVKDIFANYLNKTF